MRKLVSLGLLAFSIGFIAVPALAGNVEECEVLKDKNHPDYAPSLYGLCIAWHNADDDAKVALAEKFFERAGFEVPGSGDSNPDPDLDPPFECPCWVALTEAHICDLGYLFDTLSPGGEVGSGMEDIFTGILLFLNSADQFENFGMAPDRSECSYTIDGVGVPSANGAVNLDATNGLICGYEIGVIKDLVVQGTLECGG